MVKAVVLAGRANNGRLKNYSPVSHEAIIPIAEKPMVVYVVEALLNVPRINQVVVVGPKKELADYLNINRVSLVSAGQNMLENVQLGLTYCPETRYILIVTSDIPLLTCAAVEDFLSQCESLNCADLFYSVISREVIENYFTALNIPLFRIHRTYVNFKDGVFTGGNLVLLNPAVFIRCSEKGLPFIEARKSPLKLGRILGINFLWRFLLHQITLTEAAQRVSRFLNVKGAVVKSNFPEVGIDVDKPADLDLVREILTLKKKGGK
ncbi:MAG: nucleotidyltransferase family protein [Peptococcaceae bacterium]